MDFGMWVWVVPLSLIVWCLCGALGIRLSHLLARCSKDRSWELNRGDIVFAIIFGPILLFICIFYILIFGLLQASGSIIKCAKTIFFKVAGV